MSVITAPGHRDADATPALSLAGVRLSRVNTTLWRVLDRDGIVRGHLETATDPLGVRYRARRFRTAARAFLDVGEFWSADDAVSALIAR